MLLSLSEDITQRRYYTDDLRFYVYFNGRQWTVVNLAQRRDGKLPAKKLTTIHEVKHYLRACNG